MAINKNFVIKNGVQVNTDLIVGDSTLNKVGVGTTVPQYTLHVGATKVGGRGGIGATDLNITGVGTIQNFNVLGPSTFVGNVQANAGIVSALSFGVGSTSVISQNFELQNIAAVDATTTATIEEAIRVGPNSFSDLKVSGMSTFVGVTTYLGGIDVDVQSGVSTFSANVQFGLGPSAASAVNNFVATAATVGFGTSVFFRDNAAIFMGDGSDFRFYHDNTNSYIDNMTGALFVRNSVDNDDNSSIIFQAKSGENSIVMTNSADESNEVELYYDGSKKLQTTSGGLYVTGITTLSDRLYVESGISTFVGDVRFGIGATVGFGTSAFFRDDAAIFMGNDSDLKIHHDGSNSYIQDVGTGDLIIQGSSDIKLLSASGENYIIANDTGSVEVYYDNSKKLESTSGGLNVTGITTFSDRINVVSGVSTFQDSAKLTFGTQSDLIVWHDGSHSYIQDTTGTGNLYVDSNSLQVRNAAGNETQAVFTENGSVDLYFDNSKKVETTSGGLKVTGIATLTDRLHVQSGISTFDADVRFGIGATVGFGTSAFFKDDAAIWLGDDSDLEVVHTAGGVSKVKAADLRFQTPSHEEYIICTENAGVSVYYDNSKKLESTSGGLNVTGITTFSDRINVVSGVSTFADNAKLTFGTQGDLNLYHDGSDSYLVNNTGLTYLQGDVIRFKSQGGNHTLLNSAYTGSIDLYYNGTKRLATTAIGATAFGDFIASGVGTFARSYVSGIATFASDVNVLGDLNVTGDIVYDEITGRNLNITGITTLQGQANFGGTLGIGATIFTNGNVAASGIVTATEFAAAGGKGRFLGIHTSADGGGVGIASTTGHVGYGFTYLDLKGPGVSTVFASSVTGIATVWFRGGDQAGAAGTWAPYGDAGIATTKSVGVGTIGMGVTALQGGVKGASSGIGNSFSGLYIGNGMMVVDNQLNGDHYIGTAFNGLMAGPVTINGVLTVDGNYVVV